MLGELFQVYTPTFSLGCSPFRLQPVGRHSETAVRCSQMYQTAPGSMKRIMRSLHSFYMQIAHMWPLKHTCAHARSISVAAACSHHLYQNRSPPGPGQNVSRIKLTSASKSSRHSWNTRSHEQQSKLVASPFARGGIAAPLTHPEQQILPELSIFNCQRLSWYRDSSVSCRLSTDSGWLSQAKSTDENFLTKKARE